MVVNVVSRAIIAWHACGGCSVEVPGNGSVVDNNTEGNSVITLSRLGLGQSFSVHSILADERRPVYHFLSNQ